MKTLRLLVLFAIHSYASANTQFFGHWQGHDIQFSGTKGTAGSFSFEVSDQKIKDFLSCAANANSDDRVFLSGDAHTSTVTDAYICDGEVNLGSCTQKQYSCSSERYLSRLCKAQALSFANAGLSIQEDTKVEGQIIKSFSIKEVDAISETYLIEAVHPNGLVVLPVVEVVLIPTNGKCIPWSYSLPTVN